MITLYQFYRTWSLPNASQINDALKQHALQIDTAKTYCSRMWDKYYADFPKPV